MSFVFLGYVHIEKTRDTSGVTTYKATYSGMNENGEKKCGTLSWTDAEATLMPNQLAKDLYDFFAT